MLTPESEGIMAVINRIAEFHDEMKGWRRHLHQHPEILYDCHETAAFVVARLKEFGITDIRTGIAETGVVAVVEGRGGPGPTIGLRADMDALPIHETTGADHASKIEGKMHACGHDGHTTMLLGAAKYLAETRNFKGRVALIFQPAEEGGRGALRMAEEGVLDDYDIAQVYAIHNFPNYDFGKVFLRPGPILAAVDMVQITVTGKGGHAAQPQNAIDPLPCTVGIWQAIQTISSRNLSALENVVISLPVFQTGTAGNVIADTARLAGSIRSLQPEARDRVKRRIREICEGMGAAHGCRVEVDMDTGAPATINDPACTDLAARVARDVVGEAAVEDDVAPVMGSEDFSFMLERRPGTYILLGSGAGADLHNPNYDFNDEISTIGASWFVRMVEMGQPLDS